MRRLSYSILASAVLLISSSYSKAEDLTYNFWGLTSKDIPDLPAFETTTLLDGFKRYGAYLYNSDTGSILQISDQVPTSAASNQYWTVDPATKITKYTLKEDLLWGCQEQELKKEKRSGSK